MRFWSSVSCLISLYGLGDISCPPSVDDPVKTEQNKNKHLRLTPEANVQADQNTFTLLIKATHISVFNEIVHFLGPGLSTSVIA